MLIIFDFESYYDKEYSLSKMPTHAYVRDDRWKCLGCGFQFGLDGEPFYTEDPEPVFRKIDAYGWDKVILVAHNASFDGTVLTERFGGRKPGKWLDTSLIVRWAIAQGHLPPSKAPVSPSWPPWWAWRRAIRGRRFTVTRRAGRSTGWRTSASPWPFFSC